MCHILDVVLDQRSSIEARADRRGDDNLQCEAQGYQDENREVLSLFSMVEFIGNDLSSADWSLVDGHKAGGSWHTSFISFSLVVVRDGIPI